MLKPTGSLTTVATCRGYQWSLVTAAVAVGAASLAAPVRAETSEGSHWAATVIGGPLIVADLDAMRSQIPDTPRGIGGLLGVAGHYVLRRGSDYAQFDVAGAALGNAPFYQVRGHYVFAATKRRPYADGSLASRFARR